MQRVLTLLGDVQVFTGERWAAAPLKRTFLLYAYLALAGDWVMRDEVLALFWPTARESKARQSLRALLYQAKQEPLGGALELEATRIRWLADTDVSAFQEAVSRGEWQAAIELYRGSFLETYKAEAPSGFESWLEQTRDELHMAWRDAALHVAADLSSRAHYGEAARLLQKVLTYDFLAEDVVQAYMRVKAAAGRKTQALATFETFRGHLAQELDMKPLPTTLELADAIRRGEVQRRDAEERTARPFVAAPTTPQPLTPFVGRTLELLELANLLGASQNRLITLLGPGGMGKSRLSLRLLEDQAERYEDGVVFVALAGLRSAADIPHAAATALRLDLSGEGSVEAKILDHLQAKTMLIVFDNFEHVLGGMSFVHQLLLAAPRCTFICTSRVLLGLAGEVVYDLSGLTVPFLESDDNLEAYDAAQFFVQSARRVRSDFKLRRQDYAVLLELCKLLNGLPLALELAANWVRLFGLDELVSELRRDVDLLEASGQQVSERHQSMRRVFEHSWQLLTLEEQRVLAALSVFYGSFDRRAASLVTGASAKTLLSLANKSLLRMTASGRFSLLLVVRQYAAERLAEQGAAYRHKHAEYFLKAVANTREALKGSSLGPVLARLEQDLENIRAAWYWALQKERFGLCEGAVEPLRLFFTARAYLHEGYSLLNDALGHLQDGVVSAFAAKLRLELAYISRRLDLYKPAIRHANDALRIAQTLGGAETVIVKSLCELAHTSSREGDFAEVIRYAEQALALAQQLQNPDLIIDCQSMLALGKGYLGDFGEAEQLYRSILSRERQQGQDIDMLRTLSNMGRLYVDMNKPHQAKALFSEGLALAESQDMRYELGFMWEGLGQCSYLLGDYTLALKQGETALRYSEAVRDTIGVAVQCGEVAKSLLALGRFGEAESYLRRGLEIAWNKNELPEVMRHLLIWSAIFLERNDVAGAATLLCWVAEHPAAEAVDKQEAGRLLSSSSAEVTENARGPLAETVNLLLGKVL